MVVNDLERRGIMGEEIRDYEKLAAEYFDEGNRVFNENRLVEASLLVQNSLSLYEKAGNLSGLAEAYNLFGIICSAMGDDTRAIESYLKGLDIAKSQGFFHITGRIYNNIGSCYQEIGNQERAIEYFLNAAKELRQVNAERHSRYYIWMLLASLNIGISYTQIGSLDEAKVYIDDAKEFLKSANCTECEFDVLISECRLRWLLGDKQYVYDNIDTICEGVEVNFSTSDYIPEMKNICDLLKQMEEYDRWERVLISIEQYAQAQNSVFFLLNAVELWMDYYKAIGKYDKYVEMCVKHVELFVEQQELKNEDLCNNIDIRIELHNKEIASNTDNLTDVFNRNKLERDFDELTKEEASSPLALGIIDLDCFKEQNDCFGHVHGDECLKLVAQALEESAGALATIYRYGGDEFVVMYKDADYESINKLAKMIKEKVGALGIESAVEGFDNLSVSQGYAIVPDLSECESVYSLVKLADEALYAVKKNGRDDYAISDHCK